MKASILLLMGLLCFDSVFAQKKAEKQINFTGKDALTLNIQIADSIKIHTWNRNEVLVTSSVNINDNKDNDAYVISYDESGKSFTVKAKFKDNYFKGKCNCCDNTDIYWEVFMPEYTTLQVESINANITIDGNTNSMKVKSISGYIDLFEPTDKNADIDFSTISGTIYTNHDLKVNKTRSSVPVRISEKLNSGGSPIRLETISGDIFLRKTN
jgi:hypothetical protein